MRSVLCLSVLLCASLAFAAIPPAEWPANPDYTHQSWEFDTPDPTEIDIDFNQFGTPSLTMNVPGNFDGNSSWFIQGAVTSNPATSPMMQILIPNAPDPMSSKEVWVNVLFQANADFTDNFYLAVLDPTFNQAAIIGGPDIVPIDPGLGIYELTMVFKFPNQPQYETVILGVDELLQGEMLAIDSLQIATQCVPEPATLTLMGLGIAAICRRKK